MPKLVSMKRSKKKKKGRVNEGMESKSYSYGLGLSLGASELKKLGLKADGFKAGEKVRLTAKAVVESVSMPVEERPYEESGVSLVLTDIAVERGREDEFSKGFSEAAKRHARKDS